MFVCPNTVNVVRNETDLQANAPGGAADSNGGHSYECRNYAYANVTFADGSSWPTVVNRYEDTTNLNDWKFFKNNKRFRNLTRTCLVMDADDFLTQNWPDPGDNHGDKGYNVGFCDGHVEFRQTGRDLLEAYVNGYYFPSLPQQIYDMYGLDYIANRFSWRS